MMRTALLILSLALAVPLAAQTKLYRWVDDEGRIHYTDKIPAEYADQARARLNDQGMAVESIEAAPSPDQVQAARAKAEAAAQARRDKEEQRRLDRVLLNSYTRVSDIESARDAEILAMQRTVDMTLATVDTRRQRLRDLVDRAATLQRSGRAVPENLPADMAETRAKMVELSTYIEGKRAQQAEVFARYEQRIKRYRELTEGETGGGGR